ncbi:secretory carrier membrane protein 3 [Trypanosoma theileri]|uniref:Secretory carrier membrane protein 3 n=1 Tax=Trypanosoma theileri TaxID=67003 RepID=A0A1X0P5U6_9TRYP|nr:secretory carrier membrane protein 3 [Trypanosoma theileri]ORC91800.1 secretory carrier membrane protein 3 [Trypanosoma theileri]
MYRFESEVSELQKMYNFNSEADNETISSKTPHAPPEAPAYLEDVKLQSDGGEEVETREEQKTIPNTKLTAQNLPQPSMFGKEDSRPSPSEGASVFSPTAENGEGNKKGKREDRKENHKLRVAKEVLGLNKKSTKGMTPEEKERVLLEERWLKTIEEEKRLNALESQVRERETTMRQANLTPNFPPKFLCIKPFLHHEIALVPEPRRLYVRMNFINWIITCLLLVINTAITIGVILAPYREGTTKRFNKAQSIVLSIVYLIGIPLSFIIWYWPVYRACSTGRHTKHLLSLCGLIVALAFSVFIFVGPSNYGASGIDFARGVSETKSKILVLPVIIVLSLWGLEAVFLCYCIVKQWIFYRLDVNAQQEVRRQMRNVIGV